MPHRLCGEVKSLSSLICYVGMFVVLIHRQAPKFPK